MHSSWLFPGASSGPRQPADAASGDQPHNSNGTGFEINSFVRSLNLHGVHLPGSFPFQGPTNNNNKSLNELLNVLNDSVDRVVECNLQDRSNTSSFGSFRSGVEDRDPAALNDLINLVSTTANELRDINAGNARAESSARGVDLHYVASPINLLDIGMRTLIHPEIRARNDETPSNFSTPERTSRKHNNSRGNSRAAQATETISSHFLQNKRNTKDNDLDDTPIIDKFFTPPELVEIYSENQSPGIKRANLSAESLETLRYFETPRCFLPEVLRLAKAAGFADASSVTRDRNRSNWTSQGRRINFDNELWPIGPGINGNKAVPPYFTGTSSKAFQIRTEERNFINDNKRSMNSSRSSPIFVGAGEAPAEPLEIVVPTRDREDSFEKRETEPESRENRMIPVAIGISVEDNLFDAPPTKLNKRDTDVKKFTIEEEKPKVQTVDTNISLNIPKETEGAVASGTNEDKVKRNACVKVLTKRRRKLCKQIKKNARKKNSIKTDDEDTSEENFNSISQSPITSARKSPMQRFLEESGTIGNNEEKMMGSVKGEDDSVVTQMGICTKTCRPNKYLNAKQMKAKPSKMVIDEKNGLPIRCNILKEYEEPPKAVFKRSSSVETNQSIASSKKLCNLKNIHEKSRGNKSSAQPIWKPGGNAKVVPSTSFSSMPRQSKITQLSPRIRPNTTETSNKYKEIREAVSKSKVPLVRKNQSQDIVAERARTQSMARKSEAMVKTARSRSKQRPGTPKKSGTSEYERSDVKLVVQDRNSRPLSHPDEISKSIKVTGSCFKTTIPVLRSKTFVYQMRREPTVRRVASKEDYMSNPKSISIGSSQNSSISGPVKQLFRKSFRDHPTVTKQVDLCSDTNAEATPFDSRINSDAEPSRSDFQLNSNSNFDKIRATEFSSNDSIAAKKIAPKISQITSKCSPSYEENSKERKTREEESCEPRSKFHNKHARSLQMLKSILSHQGVSVEGVNKGAKEIRSKIMNEPAKKSKIQNACLKKPSAVLGINESNTGSLGASKTLFEKLAVLTETLSDRMEPEKEVSCEQSVSSFVDYASESVTSYARSMRDAEEQCCLHYESSFASQTSVHSEKSTESRKLQEIMKQVSNVSTEIDEDYRKNIYVDAAVSPTPSDTERITKSFEAVETQTGVNLLDKDSATEEIIQPARKCINAYTETRLISYVSKDANTDLKGPENVDATSQIDSVENSRNTASGKDFSSIQCPSKDVNTERPDFFLKSRGVCVRRPRKIDGASQFEPPEKPKDIASGRDYVEIQSISEDVNTDRQDYLYEDRSVDVLGPATVEEASQIDPPPLKIVSTAVGEFSLDVKSSPAEMLRPKMSRDLRRIETVVVKDVDVVQWQSSTTFNNSTINCESSCSSTSSLVTWHPKYSQKSSVEKFQTLGDRVPKEAIVALEMASERAQNLYKAIGIYRENLAIKKFKEPQLRSDKLVEKNQSLINRSSNLKSTAQSMKPCSFRKNSKIKSLLDANLEKLHPELNNSPPEMFEINRESFKIEEEITSLMDDLLTNVVQAVESEPEYCACSDIDKSYLDEEHFVQRNKRQRPIKLAEILEERNINEEELQSTRKTLELTFFSRNSLLTVIYGTVCSLVFWALQFSITCDSV